MKKKITANKSKLLLIIIITLFCMLFPYIFTLINLDKNAAKIYSPKMSGKMIVVKNENGNIETDVELFIPLIVYAMFPENYSKEALKAQIVITRTYIMNKMGKEDKMDVENLGLPYTTYGELEKKWKSSYEEKYNHTMKLLVETSGEVIYYNGEIIFPYYHKLSAGVTNTGEYVYLKSVDSTVDKENKKFQNVQYFSAEKTKKKLENYLPENTAAERIASLITLHYEENGEYVRTVSVGENTILVDDFVKIFEINSNAFSLEEFSGGIKIVSKGIGDGKGLSINGALEMSKTGSKYRDILKHYYSDIEIR